MATFFAGLSTLPRTVLYVCAQTIGGIAAGYWLKYSLRDAYFPKVRRLAKGRTKLTCEQNVIPGCTVQDDLISPGELFALEYLYSLALIFIIFGIGLDPRQGKTIGPTLAPFLIGAIVCLCTLSSAVSRLGYTGASFNPARCTGLMLASGNMQHNYVHWFGPMTAAMTNGLLYHVAPPWTREKPLFAGLFHRHER